MPQIGVGQPQGQLRTGWSACVDDYAIDGGWLLENRLFVVGDAAGGVHAFDAETGALQWSRSQEHVGGLLAMSVHPDGASLATSGQDGRVVVLGAKSGEVLKTLELGSGWLEHLAWSPDGQSLAVSKSRRLHVFDAQGKVTWVSDDHASTVSAIAWSSPEELVSSCYGQVSVFRPKDQALIESFEWKGSLVSLVLSPDRDVLVCGSQDNSVHFWRRSTREDSMMSGYPRKPSTLAFDDGGVLLATGGGEAVTVWSFDQGGPEGTRPGLLELHVEAITSLSFAPDSQILASGSKDGGVVTWGLAKDGSGDPLGAALVEQGVTQLKWRADGTALAALDAGGGVTVWRADRSDDPSPGS